MQMESLRIEGLPFFNWKKYTSGVVLIKKFEII